MMLNINFLLPRWFIFLKCNCICIFFKRVMNNKLEWHLRTFELLFYMVGVCCWPGPHVHSRFCLFVLLCAFLFGRST